MVRRHGGPINTDIIELIVVAATALGGLILVSAIARRIAGPYSKRHLLGGDGPEVHALRDEVAQLRHEVADLRERTAELDDVQNRLDFAERLLAQKNERP